MKVKLYKQFEHWYHGGTIWLYSDPHFNDDDCLLMNPNWPFTSAQIELINSKIGKNDTIIFLGDIGDIECVKKIKGYKVLVMGNHDKGASNYVREESFEDYNNETIEELKNKYPNFKRLVLHNDAPVSFKVAYCDNRLFDEVYEGPLFISEKILLSHEPIDIRFGINIHGHCHNGEKSIYQSNTWAHVNVCSDVIGWNPIRLDEIVDQFKVSDLHRQTIDSAIDNKCLANDPNCNLKCRGKHEKASIKRD